MLLEGCAQTDCGNDRSSILGRFRSNMDSSSGKPKVSNIVMCISILMAVLFGGRGRHCQKRKLVNSLLVMMMRKEMKRSLLLLYSWSISHNLAPPNTVLQTVPEMSKKDTQRFACARKEFFSLRFCY